jgi:hypothetical protein
VGNAVSWTHLGVAPAPLASLCLWLCHFLGAKPLASCPGGERGGGGGRKGTGTGTARPARGHEVIQWDCPPIRHARGRLAMAGTTSGAPPLSHTSAHPGWRHSLSSEWLKARRCIAVNGSLLSTPALQQRPAQLVPHVGVRCWVERGDSVGLGRSSAQNAVDLHRPTHLHMPQHV